MAYKKESWISNRRQVKRHVRARWKHGHAGRAVDGVADTSLQTCTVLDNFDVERPVWMVNLGRKVKIAGVVILTWLGRREQQLAGYNVNVKKVYSARSYNVRPTVHYNSQQYTCSDSSEIINAANELWGYRLRKSYMLYQTAPL